MENGYSLLNPEASGINYEVPVVSVIQTRDEEEEAAEDERRKEKEIRDILASSSMFDGLLDDDDDDDFNISSNASVRKEHGSAENLKQNTWQHNRPGWSEPATDRTSTRNENSFDSNEAKENNFVEQNFELEDGNESSRYDSDNIETTRNEPNQFPKNHVNAFENNEFSDLQLNQANGLQHYFERQNLKPYSTSIIDLENRKGHDIYVPQAVNHENQLYYVGSHNSDEQIQESQISDFLLSASEVKNIDASQEQMLRGGMDNSLELIQLRAICQARSNEISMLKDQMLRIQDEYEKEMDILKRNLQKMKAENESLKRAQKQSAEDIEKYKIVNSQQQGKITSLDKMKKTLDEAKLNIENKLCEAESTIESLNLRLGELENSETLSKNRIQQEKAIASLKQRYSSEIQTLREQLDESRVVNEEKDEEIAKLQHEVSKISKSSEEKLAEKLEIINRLTKSLEDSQTQCQELLKSGNKSEMTHLKSQAESNMNLRVVGDNMIKSLQEENTSLRDELEMYENIHRNLNLEGSDNFHTSISELNIDKTLHWKSPGSEKAEGDIGILSSLKRELERSLASNRAKRSKLTKLQAEHRITLKEIELLNSKLSFAEKELHHAKEKVVALQEQIQELDPHTRNAHHEQEIQKLLSEKDTLASRLEQAYQQIEELRNNETSLSNSVSHLHKQIAQLVQDHNEDRRQTLERCQQTFLQHHEESIKKIRKEMSDIHKEEIQSLQEKLKAALKELDSVKESYVEVCREKDEIEENLREHENKFKSNLQKTLQENEILWKKKLQTLEHDIEQRIKMATESAQTECDLKWQETINSINEEKDKELMQKLMELNNKFELEKCRLVKEVEEKDARNKDEEILKVKEKLAKQHELVVKRLTDKHSQEKKDMVKTAQENLKHEQMVELKRIEESHKAEREKLTAKLNEYRLEEIKQFEEKKNEESRQNLQQLVLKKNKEKCEKIKQVKEQHELEKKELLEEMEAKNKEQFESLEQIKNSEIQKLKEMIQQNELKYKKKLEFYDKMLREENTVETSDENNDTANKYSKSKESKNNSFSKHTKTFSDENDKSKPQELVKVNLLKLELAEANKKLSLKEMEIQELQISLSEKLLDENSELLVKFAEKKDKERVVALKTLAEKKNKEFQEAFMKLVAQKDIELKEALQKHQQCQCKTNTGKASSGNVNSNLKENLHNEKNYDDAYYRMLRDQNAELFKMLKSTRDEYEKEKNELQQHYVKALNAWKNKHLQMIQAYQKSQSLSKQNSQADSSEQIMFLKAEAGKLEAELKLHQCKIHELETTLHIKTSQLENLQRDHLNGLQQIEIKMQNFIDEMHEKLTEKDNKMKEKDLNYQQLLHEIQARNTEKENPRNMNAESGGINGESGPSISNELKMNELQKKVVVLEKGFTEAENKLLTVKTSLEKDIEDLKQQLEKTTKERDTAIIALQNVLETDNKNKEEAIHTSLKYQAVLKEKLRRCYKQIQVQDQQHQVVADKLRQDYAETIKNLMKHLEEISRTNAADFEYKVKEINKEHENQVSELKQQYTVKIKSLQKHYSEEFESLTKLAQHYQQIHQQIAANSNPKCIMEIEENVKKIVFALQKDVLQYLERLKLQVSETIEKEVKQDRVHIINKIKEKFEAIEITPRLENSKAMHCIGDADPKNPSIKFSIDKIPLNSIFKNWAGLPKAMSTGDMDHLINNPFNVPLKPVKDKKHGSNNAIKIIHHSQSTSTHALPVNGVPKGISHNHEKSNHSKSTKSKDSCKDKKSENFSHSRATPTNLHHSTSLQKFVYSFGDENQFTHKNLKESNLNKQNSQVPNLSSDLNKISLNNLQSHFVTSGLPREQPVGQSASEAHPSSLGAQNNSANQLTKSTLLTMTVPDDHHKVKCNSTSENSNIRLPDLKESIICPASESQEQIDYISKSFNTTDEQSLPKWQYQQYSSPDLVQEKMHEHRDQPSAHSFHPLETESDTSFSGEASGTSDQNKITSQNELNAHKNKDSNNGIKNWTKKLPFVKM